MDRLVVVVSVLVVTIVSSTNVEIKADGVWDGVVIVVVVGGSTLICISLDSLLDGPFIFSS